MALGDAQQLACLKAEKKGMSIGTILKLKAGVISKYSNCHKILMKRKQDYEELSRQFKSHVVHTLKFLGGTMLLGMAKNHAEKE